MVTDVPGVLVGHWTDERARTGCTVVVLPEGTVASGEVRGGAPATREFALLDPTRTVDRVDAVVLTGGSAFGLATAHGVVEGLAAAGRGYETVHGRVPIVVAMALYDLGVGDGTVRPGAEQGRLAFDSALDGAVDAVVGGAAGGGAGPSMPVGAVGAGAGATVDKWSGRPRPSGLGVASLRVATAPGAEPGPAEVVVSALVAVNAFGRIDDGTADHDIGPPVRPALGPPDSHGELTNTTIGVIVTNARVDKTGCQWLARSGHDGLARALYPAHMPVDGDALVAAATGQVKADPMHLRLLAQAAVTRAVRSLARLG
jgi:L-aminopeptidase/D-esterase-like protein